MPVTFEFDFEKALAGVLYLASQPERVTALDKYKIAKLIFLADKYHLVRYGRPIFGDYYKALEFGPVPQQILNLLHQLVEASGGPLRGEWAEKLAQVLQVDRRWEHPRFTADVSWARFSGALSESDRRALDHIIELYGKMDFNELKAITHTMAAYRRAWETRRGRQTAPMKYEDFFEEDSDAVAGAKEEMLENDAIRKAFSGQKRRV